MIFLSDRNFTQYKIDCEARWKVTPQPKMADITYGSKKLDAASNIVFRYESKEELRVGWRAAVARRSSESE
jgi:hypothetical protein